MRTISHSLFLCVVLAALVSFPTGWWIDCAAHGIHLDGIAHLGLGVLGTISDVVFNWISVGCSSRLGQPKFDIVWNLCVIRSRLSYSVFLLVIHVAVVGSLQTCSCDCSYGSWRQG
jgi:hypothetical protein